jgi:hypothetical protein
MGIFKKNTSREPQGLAAITAGGSTYRVSNYTDFTQISLLRQDWQQQAFSIYDAEGHLFYATNYVGGAMSRIKLVGATKPKTYGELEGPQVIKEGPVADAIAAIASPLGGQSGFLRQIGRNIFLTGEAWIIAASNTLPDGSVEVNWDAVSVDELVAENGTQMRRSLPGGQPTPLPKGTLTFRIWKEHPRYSQLADSGTRSCIELLEKIIILNRAEKAVARSQLAGSGILALPQELVPPAWQNQGNTPNPMESNPLWQALAESMMAPLTDASAPSAVVPLLLVGPGEVIKNMKYEPLNRRFDSAAAQASIKMAIEQIANTLELPKEILLGVGEATHWTAWAIREDVFQAHIQPLIELVCAGLTKTFLRQALDKFSDEQLKAAGIENRDDVIVWYDASELVIQPDRADKMLGLHDRFVITDDALAKALDVPEAERLDNKSEEYKMRVGIKMADAKMAVTGTPTEPPAPAAPAAGGGGAGPKGISPSRGKSPQGPKSSPPKLPSERRAGVGLPQDSKTVTASAKNDDGAALGRFDLTSLRTMREMAERHLRRALDQAVTASADPSDFISEEFIDEFTDLADLTWQEGIGIVNMLVGDLPVPLYQSTVKSGILSAASEYRDLLKAMVSDKAFGREPIYGEFMTGALVQYGDVRPLLVTLGGGSPEVTVPLYGGVATGNTMSEWLGSNGIDTSKKIWLYGWEEQARRTFNGHLQMDGLVFENWEDDGLKIAPQDAWLRRSHYAPGDHWGCSCVVAPYVPNFGPDYTLQLSPSD